MPDAPPPAPATPGEREPGGGAPQAYVLATWGQRAAATLVDGALLLLPILLVWAVTLPAVAGAGMRERSIEVELDRWVVAGDAAGLLVLLRSALLTALVALLLAWLVIGLYSAAWMARTGGATLGRRLARIRVVREDGNRTTFLWSFHRTFVIRDLALGLGSLATCGLVQIVQYLLPLVDRGGRTLHDMLSRSRVVQDPPA